MPLLATKTNIIKKSKIKLKLKKVITGNTPSTHKSFDKPKHKKPRAIYEADTIDWVNFPDEIIIEVESD